MAEIASALNIENDAFRAATWADLKSGDSGAPMQFVGYSDRSVQVFGNFGVGGSVRIEGSNDGVNWSSLSDPTGAALDISTAKIKAIAEMTRYMRPRITAGDGSTNLTVVAMFRRTS